MSNIDHRWEYPPGFSLQDIISRGNSGFILRKPSSTSVIKYPWPWRKEAIQQEDLVYQRLGHECNLIVRYCGKYEKGIELEYVSGGCLTTVLQELGDCDQNQKLHWARQYVEAIGYIHSKNICYWDLSCNNAVLECDGTLKLLDFEHAEIMGEFPFTTFCHPEQHHRCPLPNQRIRDDIFKLGIVLFSILEGFLPYDSDDDPTSREITERYQKGKFRQPTSLFKDIIRKCWSGDYECLDVIHAEVNKTSMPSTLYFIPFSVLT
jgi:serine/threonine protein kinase